MIEYQVLHRDVLVMEGKYPQPDMTLERAQKNLEDYIQLEKLNTCCGSDHVIRVRFEPMDSLMNLPHPKRTCKHREHADD